MFACFVCALCLWHCISINWNFTLAKGIRTNQLLCLHYFVCAAGRRLANIVPLLWAHCFHNLYCQRTLIKELPLVCFAQLLPAANFQKFGTQSPPQLAWHTLFGQLYCNANGRSSLSFFTPLVSQIARAGSLFGDAFGSLPIQWDRLEPTWSFEFLLLSHVSFSATPIVSQCSLDPAAPNCPESHGHLQITLRYFYFPNI